MSTGSHRWRLLWVIPLVLVVLVAILVLTLPRWVASDYNRAGIERLASSLTGRSVHINGRLSLQLLPHPQFVAGNVTITGPAPGFGANADQETVTAASLTLDIAPLPLLRGVVLARSITLRSPHIALPWPLPGGAAAIAPPRWLTALHAQISNGQIHLGAITFNHVSADIFTGGDGAFSVAGTGTVAGTRLNLSLGFGTLSAVGSAPVTLDLRTVNAPSLQAHVTGTYDSSGTVSGTATFAASSLAGIDPALAAPASGAANLTAGPDRITLAGLSLRQGNATLTGNATLALSSLSLTLLLSGRNLDLPLSPATLAAASAWSSALPPIQLALDATNTTLGSGAVSLPHLHGTIDFGSWGANITSLTVTLPGSSHLSLAGTLNPAGALQAKAAFESSAPAALVLAYGGPALPPGLPPSNLTGDVSGTLDQLGITGLRGNIGTSRVTGTAVLVQRRELTGGLHFDQLDLTPIAAMLRNLPDGFAAAALTSDFEISADRATIDKIPLAHLLIDARLGNQLVVRRLTAAVYGGIAAASFTLSPNPGQSKGGSGLISSAQAVLALPSAQPVAALLPAWAQPPPVLTKAPLALSILAAGPANALATSASLTLGQISVTAAPSIDLIHQVAAGAFTFRHPNAIAAFKAFGLNAGLPWPGAGSIALRANMLLSPARIGFSDFVLSMGDLTANGRLLYGPDHGLDGEIDADTLALPPIPANFMPPWAQAAALHGQLGVSANRVLLAGRPILGPAAASLALAPNRLDLTLTRASLGNGVLNANLTAITNGAAPALSAKFILTGADAAQLALPVAFPITLQGGSLDASGNLTASGYAVDAWLASLSGNAELAVRSGTLGGFNLPAAAAALTGRPRRADPLRSACLAGATPFAQLEVTGGFSNGIYALQRATLQGPAGSATASGSIDLPDAGIDLNAILLPAVPQPPTLGLAISGSWAAPRQTLGLQQALAWKPNAATP